MRVPPDAPEDDAITRLDAYLCDLKDLRIGDGLHVFGGAPPPEQRAALLADCPAEALDRLAAGRDARRCWPHSTAASSPGSGGRAQPGPCRRAAHRAQSLRHRPARGADALRAGARPARLRRAAAPPRPGERRLAATDRARPLGQCDHAHRRRGSGAGAAAARRPAALGRGDRPRAAASRWCRSPSSTGRGSM